MAYLNITITVLDIIHRPVFYLETRRAGELILSPLSGRAYSDGINNKNSIGVVADIRRQMLDFLLGPSE
jgi:hypothetical protein